MANESRGGQDQDAAVVTVGAEALASAQRLLGSEAGKRERTPERERQRGIVAQRAQEQRVVAVPFHQEGFGGACGSRTYADVGVQPPGRVVDDYHDAHGRISRSLAHRHREGHDDAGVAVPMEIAGGCAARQNGSCHVEAAGIDLSQSRIARDHSQGSIDGVAAETSFGGREPREDLVHVLLVGDDAR